MENGEKNSLVKTRTHLVLFMSLLFLSMGFFVSAQDDLSGKNIFYDSDQDGLATEEEKLYKTDPNNRDTDGDGYSDGVEVKGGYDPTKPAPGDKIVPEKEMTASETQASGSGGDNLTEQISEEIASLIQDTQTENGTDELTDISIEDLDALIQKAAAGEYEEVSLPEIDTSTIKVKKQSYSKLSSEKKKEKIKEDIVEYLSVVGYIFANSSPKEINSNDELRSFAEETLNQSINALSLGNIEYFDSLAENGRKILDQLKDVEVPEQMFDAHVKAMRFALYAEQLKDEFRVDPNQDPLKMISSIAKARGFLSSLILFVDEVQARMEEYGIEDNSFDLDL